MYLGLLCFRNDHDSPSLSMLPTLLMAAMSTQSGHVKQYRPTTYVWHTRCVIADTLKGEHTRMCRNWACVLRFHPMCRWPDLGSVSMLVCPAWGWATNNMIWSISLDNLVLIYTKPGESKRVSVWPNLKRRNVRILMVQYPRNDGLAHLEIVWFLLFG